MNLCDDYDIEIKETVLFTLINLSRIQFLRKKDSYATSPRKYDDVSMISYSDCLTIEFMKEKEIRNIISFNENLDRIEGVNRIYGFDTFNKKRLNFLKYDDV